MHMLATAFSEQRWTIKRVLARGTPPRFTAPTADRTAVTTSDFLSDGLRPLSRELPQLPGLEVRLRVSRLCDDLCRSAGFAPTVGFESEDISTLRGFVAAGLGVALLPGSGRQSAGEGAQRIPYLDLVDVHAIREIALSWPADRRLLPAAELFRQHVVDRGRNRRIAPTS